MKEELIRTGLIYGEEGMARLAEAHVAVFGVGGVGGYVCEALARSGVGKLDLIDSDVVSVSNINRQIIALHSTVGRPKVEVMEERIRDINPDCEVKTWQTFFLPDTADQFPFSDYDYVVDAIDTVTGKLQLVMKCHETKTPIISSMGAGNKVDPTKFQIADISRTTVCPLARTMRRELKDRGIQHLKVVYSTEYPAGTSGSRVKPVHIEIDEKPSEGKRSIPGSNAFTPSVAGLLIAAEVINDLTGVYEDGANS